jgi:uncharacterized peroxidase-related enzyme
VQKKVEKPNKTKEQSITSKAGKSAASNAAAGDDTKITALALPQAKLSPAMAAYFDKCREKLGFVPNVLAAYAFDNAKLEAFVALYNDLMLAPSGLSKLEREMIAVAVSSQNHCYYCLVAHGAAVRALSNDPVLGELMVMNYRAARLSKRQRAMLDFAVKLTVTPWEKAMVPIIEKAIYKSDLGLTPNTAGTLIRISKRDFVNAIKVKPHYALFLSRLLAQRVARRNAETVGTPASPLAV